MTHRPDRRKDQVSGQQGIGALTLDDPGLRPMRAGHSRNFDHTLEPLAAAANLLGRLVEHAEPDTRHQLVRSTEVHPDHSTRIVHQRDPAVGLFETMSLAALEHAVESPDGRAVQGELLKHHRVLLLQRLLQLGNLVSLP